MSKRLVVWICLVGLWSSRCVNGWVGGFTPIQGQVGRRSGFVWMSSSSSEEEMGLNELQTLLREAVKKEEYGDAKKYSDILQQRLGITNKKQMSWRGLGTAPWLEDRLDALDYKFPTTIQITSLASVNALLADHDTSQPQHQQQLGVVISGSTGSGKTLAYMVPLLSTLSESLFTRQRIRVQSEESIEDVANDLMERVAIQTGPPDISGVPKQRSSMGKSGTDVQHPLALIVIPTRELGVQIALQLYQLVGGGGNTKKTTGLQNMFKYKGPKGVKIGCILEEEEAEQGLKLQTDIAITTPEFLPKLLADGDIVTEQLRVIVYDEADLCLEETSNDDLKRLFNVQESDDDDDDDFISEQSSRLTYLVGASVTKSLGELCVKDAVLPAGKSYIATATHFAPLTLQQQQQAEEDNQTEKGGTLVDLNQCLDPGLRHERVLIPEGSTGLFCLTQLLRTELRKYEQQKNIDDKDRPRVVVFFPNEVQAKESIGKLRDAMWGDHKLCVLLPNMGVNPLQMMQDYKNGKTSVLLATPHSVRGLDFPNVTHVYTLYSAADTPADYLHLAGRVGRIGQKGSYLGSGGRVTSIIPHTDTTYPTLAQTLNFTFVDIDVPPPLVGLDTTSSSEEDDDDDDESSNIEDLRRYLEDKFTLLDEVNDLDMTTLEQRRTQTTTVYENNDDEDDDEEEEEEE